MAHPHHNWTDEDRDIVRRDYDGTNASAQRIAGKLGVTIFSVKGQVQSMGLAIQKSPRWSEEELARLEELIHRYSITQIAKKLKRSRNAVKIKATRLKMGLRVRDGWFTKREACEILGVDHRKVQSWIDSGALVATWHNGIRPQKNGTAMWHITTGALRSFIISYSGELLGRNVDIQQIVFILSGMAES